MGVGEGTATSAGPGAARSNGLLLAWTALVGASTLLIIGVRQFYEVPDDVGACRHDAAMPSSDRQTLHRDGGMIIGGQGYSLAELGSLPPLARHSCGIPELDAFTGGGLAPGAVWTLAAPNARGATTFAIQVAIAASQTGRVILVNGHMATHLLRDRVVDIARATGFEKESLVGLRIASWVSLLDWEEDDLWCGDGMSDDVVVLDTLDEMWRPQVWPSGPEERLRRLRWLREVHQRRQTAVLMTARVQHDGEGFAESWQAHWAYEVFADIADVRLELRRGRHCEEILAYARGLGWWLSKVSARPPNCGAFRVVQPRVL